MAMAWTRTALLFIVVGVLASIFPSVHAEDEDCVYTVYVRTGSIWKGGTDSTISVEFYDYYWNSIYVGNLTQWGGDLQGQDRDYFERGSLDIFSGLGVCLDSPICGLDLASDGKGDNHGWYVNYVEVTGTGAHLGCSQHTFNINRWLATDASPYSLTYSADECEVEGRPPRRQTT